jgi:hypothetical protein
VLEATSRVESKESYKGCQEEENVIQGFGKLGIK